MATSAESRPARSRRNGSEAVRPARKSAQMMFRITPDLKALVEEAAAISGRSATDFVTEAARERAIQVLREQQDVTVWRLAGEDARAFAEAITGPPVPRPRLAAAYAKYRQMKELRRSPEPGADEQAT